MFEEVFIRVSLKRLLYDFLWRGFYTIFSEEVSTRFSLKRFYTRFDRFNDGRITDKIWSVSRVEMIYIHNMNDSQECFDMNWLMYINMWKPNTLAIELYFFCHNRRNTSLEKFQNIISTLNARTRARFSRCYIWCENNKRPSEDFHSKLIIDNMYVEVTLQTEYNIRKNSRNFFYNSNLPGFGAHKGTRTSLMM